MRLNNNLTRRMGAAALGFGCIGAALTWGASFGAGRPHVTIASSGSNLSYTAPRASAALAATGAERVIRTWNLADGLRAAGWESTPGLRTTVDANGLAVITTPTRDVQLRSPLTRLPIGAYFVLVDGVVSTGGLQAGVETADGRDCSSAAYFDPKSTTPDRSSLPVRFSGDPRHPVRIVLINWSDVNRASVWYLRRVRIVVETIPKQRRLAARYSALASPLVRVSDFTTANLLYKWSFARAVPTDWRVTPQNRLEPSGSALLVRTGRAKYGYVLTAKLRLGRGPYLLRVDGRILSGGLGLGIVDLETNSWLGHHLYWYGQANSLGVMAVPFSLGHAANVELVLANWTLTPSASTWRLRGVELDQLF